MRKQKTSELRRSPQTLSLIAALVQRASDWHYGYDLSRATGLKSGTLYPILMRMSERGWLESRWEESAEGKPPRHLYRLTADGRRCARVMLAAAPAAMLRPAMRGGEA